MCTFFIHTSNVYYFAYIPVSWYIICALIYSNISNIHRFAYVPESGKTICSLLYHEYVKCLIFRIYSRVGVIICALLYRNILNVYCFAYIPESGKTICALLMCQMFTISHIFLCQGKQYVHFYSNISYV